MSELDNATIAVIAAAQAFIDILTEGQKKEILADVGDVLAESDGIPEFDEISLCLVVKDANTIVYAAELSYEGTRLGFVELAEYKREKLQ